MLTSTEILRATDYEVVVEKTRLYFDISDLIQYFRDNRAPTGIQRVQIEIVSAFLELAEISVIAMSGSNLFWDDVDPAQFLNLVNLSLIDADVSQPDWQNALASLGDPGATGRTNFKKNSILVNLGTSWWLPQYMSAVAMAQQEHSIFYVPFIHDIIPVKVPEHCSEELVREFVPWIYNVIARSHGILANSEHTARDVAELAHAIHGRSLNPIVCQLDAAPPFLCKASETVPLEFSHLNRMPFMLFVGTIESRKNHLFVFDAILRLVRMNGSASVPTLICVGKLGWLNEAALARYNNSSILQEKIQIYSNISDIQLAWLYKNCLFTIYNSFYEGWGLPVTEGLCFGRPAVVARNTSLVEAGGEWSDYFNPNSQDDFISVVSRLLYDEDYRTQRSEAVRAGHRNRTWPEIASSMMSALLALGEDSSEQTHLSTIQLGTIYHFKKNPSQGFRDGYLKGALLLMPRAWWAFEDWGTWSRSSTAGIRVVLPSFSTSLCLYIEVLPPPEISSVVLRINGVNTAILPLNDRQRFLIAVPEAQVPSKDFIVEIINTKMSDLAFLTEGDDKRVIGIGIASMMICNADDYRARLSYLERMGSVTVVDIETWKNGSLG